MKSCPWKLFYMCTHTQAPTYTSMLITQNLISTQLKSGSKQQLEMDEDSSMEQKTWLVYSLGKRNVLRFDLKESREGFCGIGRGRSFHVEEPKMEKAQEPAVESLVQGIWRLGVSEAEWTVCRVEDRLTTVTYGLTTILLQLCSAVAEIKVLTDEHPELSKVFSSV